MNRLTGLIREPLLHFLAAGVALFLVFEFVGDRDSELDPRTISVDREVLLTFMQFRLRSFDNNAASARLDNASESERAAFVEDFIREEALYREALGLGLDKDDYIIRRRLVQKVEFLA